MGVPDDPTRIDPDDRRKHLDYVQAVITRMAGASASAKSWLLPVVTATYGYALTKHAESVALVGMGAIVLFMFLDVNYLRQEQAYRKLYKTVASGSKSVPDFSLDPSDADDPIPGAATCGEKAKRLWRRWIPAWQTWMSWSVAPFYGALLLAGLAIIVRVWWVTH